MNILAIETATEACTAALKIGDDIAEQFAVSRSDHSQQLLVMVEQLLQQADISLSRVDTIAFGRGPGSFTGVRIAAGVTQGLACAADLPVVPISSLAALAQGIDAGHVAAAFDARMAQVYCATYLRSPAGLVCLQGEERVIAPRDFILPEEGAWTGAGSGWDRYAADIMVTNHGRISDWRTGCHPHARDLAVLAEQAYQSGAKVLAAEALPVYLRNNVAGKTG